jgi:hypothetical protein
MEFFLRKGRKEYVEFLIIDKPKSISHGRIAQRFGQKMVRLH